MLFEMMLCFEETNGSLFVIHFEIFGKLPSLFTSHVTFSRERH